MFENVNKILMIQKITIEGYKSIKEQTVELFPINILIGGNGIGKSNFISAFTLIHNLYERNLQNKYASWEQELTRREQTVREKERATYRKYREYRKYGDRSFTELTYFCAILCLQQKGEGMYGQTENTGSR